MYIYVNKMPKSSKYTIVCTPIHKTNAHHPRQPFLNVKVVSASYDNKRHSYGY